MRNNKDAYDSRSDIWDLGITLAELVYGKFPFEDGNGEDLENFISIIHFIQNLDANAFVNKCFARNYKDYKLTKEFILLCLREYNQRPKYEALISTLFYKNYSNLLARSRVLYFEDSPALYTHDSPDLEIETIKSSITPQHMEFYVPKRYIPGEIMGSGARGIVM